MKCNSEISCKLLPWIVFIAEGHKSMLPALSYKGLDTDTVIQYTVGFLGGSVAKNPPANAGDMGSIPGSGGSPEKGNGCPLQYSCLENLMDRA